MPPLGCLNFLPSPITQFPDATLAQPTVGGTRDRRLGLPLLASCNPAEAAVLSGCRWSQCRRVSRSQHLSRRGACGCPRAAPSGSPAWATWEAWRRDLSRRERGLSCPTARSPIGAIAEPVIRLPLI